MSWSVSEFVVIDLEANADRSDPPEHEIIIDGSRPPMGRSLDELARYLLSHDPRQQHRALDDARLLHRVLPALLGRLGGTAPSRRLQRWVLAAGRHPWSGFLAAPSEPIPLEEAVPASDWPQRGPRTGEFDPQAVAAMLGEGGSLMGRARRPRRQPPDAGLALEGEIDRDIDGGSEGSQAAGSDGDLARVLGGGAHGEAGGAGSNRPYEPLGAIRRSVERVRSASERFGEVLVGYLRIRTGASADDKYPVSHRIRRSSDVRRPDYGEALATGKHLVQALRALADALNKVNLPEKQAGRYRRHRLEAEVARHGRFARDAARIVDSVLWVEDPDEQIAIGSITYDPKAGRWTWELKRSPVSVAGSIAFVWDSMEAAVLTSATIRAGGSFDHIIESLGLGAVERPVGRAPAGRREPRCLGRLGRDGVEPGRCGQPRGDQGAP